MNNKQLSILFICALCGMVGAFFLGYYVAKEQPATVQETSGQEARTIPLISTHKLVDRNPVDFLTESNETQSMKLYGKEILLPSGCEALFYTNSTVPNITVCKNDSLCAIFSHHTTETINDAADYDNALQQVSYDLLNVSVLQANSILFNKDGAVAHAFDFGDNLVIAVTTRGSREMYSILLYKNSIDAIEDSIVEFLRSFKIEDAVIESLLP